MLTSHQRALETGLPAGALPEAAAWLQGMTAGMLKAKEEEAAQRAVTSVNGNSQTGAPAGNRSPPPLDTFIANDILHCKSCSTDPPSISRLCCFVLV